MRKIISRIFIFVMAITFITSLMNLKGEDVKAATKRNVTVKTSVGFNDKYKIGYFTPMNITIKNDDKDIQGTIEVRVPTAQNLYNSYSESLSIQKDSEKTVTINVPVKQAFLKYKIIIKDGNDEVYSDEVKVGNTANQAVKFVGILSDDFDSLTYLNKVPSAKGITYSTELIKLNEKNFPDYLQVLKSFDIIIINNFDTSKLSKEAYESLKNWVKLGGTLVIGTGTNYNKTLGIFKDDFIKGQPGELTKINTSKIYNIATNGDNNNSVAIEALNMQLDNSKIDIQEGNVKLLQSINIGKGYVGIAAFDFGLQPFAGWANNTAFGEKVFGMVNDGFAKENMQGAFMEQYYSVSELVSNLGNKLPNTKIFFIILVIYILIVAPLSYFILKRIDKRELMWITVPCIAIIFGIIVYFMGSGTRISDITANNASSIRLDKNGIGIKDTYVGIFTPRKMEVEVSSKDGERLEPVDSPNYNGNPDTAEAKELDTLIREDKGTLEFHNKSIISNKVLKMPTSTVNVGKIETNIKINGADLTGSIKNLTTFDFDYCYVITPRDYYIVGAVKKGQSMNLPSKSGSYSGDINQLSYDNKLFNIKGNIQADPESLLNSSLLRFAYLNGIKGGRVDGISVVGISKDKISKPLIANGKESALKDRTVILMPIELSFRNGDNIEYPAGYVDTNVLNPSGINFDSYGQIFYGPGTPEVLYSIDKNMSVTDISLNLTNKSNIGVANVSTDIYNYKDGKYESIKKDELSGDEIQKYLNGNNELKLRFNLNNNEQYQLPEISVKGKVK